MALTQAEFTKELLLENGITTFKRVTTHLPLNLKLYRYEGDVFEDAALLGNTITSPIQDQISPSQSSTLVNIYKSLEFLILRAYFTLYPTYIILVARVSF